MTKNEKVIEMLHILGAAWRSDWSDFDGRMLRDQLDFIAMQLRDDVKECSVEDFMKAELIKKTEYGYGWDDC